MLLIVFTQSLHHMQDMTRSIFKWSTAGLNSEFSFQNGCLTKEKEPSLHYYLHIAGRRKDSSGFSQGH